MQISRANNEESGSRKNAKLSENCFYMIINKQGDFQICISITLIICKHWVFVFALILFKVPKDDHVSIFFSEFLLQTLSQKNDIIRHFNVSLI